MKILVPTNNLVRRNTLPTRMLARTSHLFSSFRASRASAHDNSFVRDIIFPLLLVVKKNLPESDQHIKLRILLIGDGSFEIQLWNTVREGKTYAALSKVRRMSRQGERLEPYQFSSIQECKGAFASKRSFDMAETKIPLQTLVCTPKTHVTVY